MSFTVSAIEDRVVGDFELRFLIRRKAGSNHKEVREFLCKKWNFFFKNHILHALWRLPWVNSKYYRSLRSISLGEYWEYRPFVPFFVCLFGKLIATG